MHRFADRVGFQKKRAVWGAIRSGMVLKKPLRGEENQRQQQKKGEGNKVSRRCKGCACI